MTVSMIKLWTSITAEQRHALIGCCGEGGGKLSDASVHGYGHPPDEDTFKLSCKNTAHIF